MNKGVYDQLVELERQIRDRRQNIENQQILIEVLERDGHDVREQETALELERNGLAAQITQHRDLRDRLSSANSGTD